MEFDGDRKDRFGEWFDGEAAVDSFGVGLAGSSSEEGDDAAFVDGVGGGVEGKIPIEDTGEERGELALHDADQRGRDAIEAEAGGGEFGRNTAGPKLAAKSVTTKAGRGM